MQPSIGMIVHVRIGGSDEHPILRPAIVTNTFGGQICNAQVFLDHTNDSEERGVHIQAPLVRIDQLRAHGYSLQEGDSVGQWRSPPRFA
jgi:hypothetical protein